MNDGLNVLNRDCNSCTKCCEGHLIAEVRGHQMGPKPCPFVKVDVGCGDYENRPQFPCRQFKCQYLLDDRVPEHMYPKNSGFIMSYQEVAGNGRTVLYLALTPAPKDPTADDLTWFILFGLQNKINISWDVSGKKYWIGNDVFLELMEDKYIRNA